MWNAETGQELLTFKGQKYFNGVVFSPDGHWLATGTEDKAVLLYDATPLPEKP